MKYWIQLAKGHSRALNEHAGHLKQAEMNRITVEVAECLCPRRHSACRSDMRWTILGKSLSLGPRTQQLSRVFLVLELPEKTFSPDSRPLRVFHLFQGSCHFNIHQRLRLETVGWRILDFTAKPFTQNDLE